MNLSYFIARFQNGHKVACNIKHAFDLQTLNTAQLSILVPKLHNVDKSLKDKIVLQNLQQFCHAMANQKGPILLHDNA